MLWRWISKSQWICHNGFKFLMMTITDIKIYTLNAVAMALNFTDVDLGLKIILTIVAIGYTINKWWYMVQEKRNK